jgi:hypothetical protein
MSGNATLTLEEHRRGIWASLTGQGRSCEPNQLAAKIVAIATGQDEDYSNDGEPSGKHPAAVELGRLGVLEGEGRGPPSSRPSSIQKSPARPLKRDT